MVEGSYSIGGAGVGVRSTSREFGRWLDHALATHRSSEKAIPVYSVVVAEPQGGARLAKERYHILYKGTIAIIKTPDFQTLARTLLSDLEMYLFQDRDDAIFADMNVVTSDGLNALVPGSVVPFIGTLGRRRLGRTGLTLPTETVVAIERSSGRVVPIRPMVEVTAGALDLLGDVAPADGRDPRMVVERPLSIDVLVSVGWGSDPVVPVTKGLALYRLGSHVANLERLGGGAIEGTRPIVERARCFEVASAKPAEMLDALLQIFRTEKVGQRSVGSIGTRE